MAATKRNPLDAFHFAVMYSFDLDTPFSEQNPARIYAVRGLRHLILDTVYLGVVEDTIEAGAPAQTASDNAMALGLYMLTGGRVKVPSPFPQNALGVELKRADPENRILAVSMLGTMNAQAIVAAMAKKLGAVVEAAAMTAKIWQPADIFAPGTH